ncbi:MAG: FHA domain-containing protein [Bacteriovoracaceae bacterium]|nr:FHA domain-containing protein [Bacteriovoracaceae bacterium]
MKVALKVVSPGINKEHVITQNGAVTFGRSRQCEFQLEDTKISGKHCRLNLKVDRLELSDLESKNGTYLNGIRVEQTEVFVGDEIRIGDTLITMAEQKMDEADINALSFNGQVNDRMDYALKADFTGARINNQLANKRNASLKVSQAASHAREIDLRKRANSKIKISKQEIRSRNKLASLMATLIDVVSLLIVLTLPLFVVATLPGTVNKGTRLLVLGTLSTIMGVGFIIYNYKKSKFTVGEKLAGIMRLYSEQ